MSEVHYHVVEHDGGWAYKVGDVFSETFRTREEAHAAAEIAAREQERGGDDETIEYQDADGKWKVETAKGGDRPASDVDN
jgi:hypothetical protein